MQALEAAQTRFWRWVGSGGNVRPMKRLGYVLISAAATAIVTALIQSGAINLNLSALRPAPEPVVQEKPCLRYDESGNFVGECPEQVSQECLRADLRGQILGPCPQEPAETAKPD